jgi:hypothetical protein
MKKFIRKFLFFILFFLTFSVVINSIFLVIIATTDWDFVKRLESLRFKNPDFKLLVLGTSLAEYGIDTELLTSNGYKSYNLAMVGSSIKTNYIQLNEYLTRYEKKPQYVLLAVNSFLEQFDQTGIQPVIEFTMKGHTYGLKDVPISKFRWAGMELLKKGIRSVYRKTYVSYGQKKSFGTVPDFSSYTKLSLDLHKYESAYWIGEIARLCEQKDIDFIVIEIPAIKEAQNQSDEGPYRLKFSNGHSALLYNYNSRDFCSFIDTAKDWSGRSHFNKNGAEKFTKELTNTLNTAGLRVNN